MRMRISILAALAVAIAGAGLLLPREAAAQAKAGKQRDFVIAGSDGYGTQECLASHSQCGRIVADAWCEAKGFKAALAYRPLERDEITGSTGAASNKQAESFLISCRD